MPSCRSIRAQVVASITIFCPIRFAQILSFSARFQLVLYWGLNENVLKYHVSLCLWFNCFYERFGSCLGFKEFSDFLWVHFGDWVSIYIDAVFRLPPPFTVGNSFWFFLSLFLFLEIPCSSYLILSGFFGNLVFCEERTYFEGLLFVEVSDFFFKMIQWFQNVRGGNEMVSNILRILRI